LDAALGAVCILLALSLRRPRNFRVSEDSESDDDDDDDEERGVDGNGLPRFDQGQRVSMALVSLLILVYFFIFTTGSVYETVVVPFTFCAYRWHVVDNAGLFAIAGLFSGLAFALMYFSETPTCASLCVRACRTRRFMRASGSAALDFLFILPSLAGLVGGYLLMIAFDDSHNPNPPPQWRFILGSVFVTFTFPLSFSGLVNIYSRLLAGKSARAITARMRLLKAGGYLARMTAPLWAGCVAEYPGIDIVFIVAGSGALLAFALMSMLGYRLNKLIRLISAAP
jgi:hypothetical protein